MSSKRYGLPVNEAWLMNEYFRGILETKPKRDFFDNFYISLKHRYAFHAISKVASSTIKHLCYKKELEDSHYPMPSVHIRNTSPLLSPYQLSDEDLSRVLEGNEFFRFTFVRNPYSRLLSCYLDRIMGGVSRPYRQLVTAMGRKNGYQPSFEEFIVAICSQSVYQQNNHWRVQYYDAMKNSIDYHTIGKQEYFNRDFSKIYYRIFYEKLEDESLEVNASPSKTDANSKLLNYWTPELASMVQEKYSEDFSFFQYEKELVV